MLISEIKYDESMPIEEKVLGYVLDNVLDFDKIENGIRVPFNGDVFYYELNFVENANWIECNCKSIKHGADCPYPVIKNTHSFTVSGLDIWNLAKFVRGEK